jgi:P27 family predicted phage terminase small subunit
MASPKARPTKLKLLEGRGNGRDSGGRVVPEAPAFRRLPPLKPITLSPLAAEHWDLIVEELMRLELTKPLDAGSLAAACEAWARFATATASLNRALDTKTVGAADAVWGKRRATVMAVNEASREYRAWASEFGLTPSSESRLGAKREDGDGENPFGGRAALP